MHWDKVTAGQRGTGLVQFLDAVRALPKGQVWRHNQAGDLPGIGNRIDGPALRALTAANKGKRGFTYTHKPPRGNNLRAIRRANREGFTVNLSANSITHADMLMELGLPVAAVGPIDHQAKRIVTPGGNVGVTCPATYDPFVTCGGGRVKGSDGIWRDTRSCGTVPLCAIPDRKYFLIFPAHGASRRKAHNISKGNK